MAALNIRAYSIFISVDHSYQSCKLMKCAELSVSFWTENVFYFACEET